VIAAVAAAVLSVAFFGALLTGVLGTTGTTVLDDYLSAAVPLAAGVLALRRGGHPGEPARRGWLLLGASCLSWGIGGAVWAVYEVHLGIAVPFPSLADLGYLGAVPLALGALSSLSGSARAVAVQARAVLDGALVACALLFLSWATVLGPVVRAGDGSPFTRGIALAYPISDVLLATMALLAVARAHGARRVAMTLIGLGLVSVAISDTAFAWYTAQGQYGTPFDVGYVAGYCLVALAATHPGRFGTQAGPELPRRAGTVLPYVPVLASGGLAVGLHLTGRSIDPFLFWDGLLVLGLVLLRQLFSLNVNLALSRELQETVAVLGQREAQLRHQAFHDPLTGLPNRLLFTECVREGLARPGPAAVTVMLLDLDDFKTVNDTLGHTAGDALLVDVAERLRRAVRVGDTVARLGGDEFAIVLTGPWGLTEALATGERILGTLEEPVRLDDHHTQVRVSIGVAHSDEGPSLEQLLRHADVAMYRAKAQGKGRLAVFATPAAPARVDTSSATRW
jgi:diguanylate cyclase